MSGMEDGWDSALSRWAHSKADIRALVQIGSRAQAGAAADAWSDYDYQLVTTEPGWYADGSFCRELGPCWAIGSHVAFGNALKVTAVYDGALEADFVILRHLELVAATLALRWPGTRRFWPRPLATGISNLRIVVGPGWKMIKGGTPWEERYSRITPHRPALGEPEFRAICGDFWAQLVWAGKKVARGEFRAAERTLHAHLIEHALRLLQEEALLAGRQAFPLGRRAESWLTRAQLAATDFATAPNRADLMAALGRIAEVFSLASEAVAAANGWKNIEHAEVSAWLAGLPAR